MSRLTLSGQTFSLLLTTQCNITTNYINKFIIISTTCVKCTFFNDFVTYMDISLCCVYEKGGFSCPHTEDPFFYTRMSEYARYDVNTNCPIE
ncbi:hypothetical protein J3Q64DRAFT_1709337 [Phycomyces blakesleeanus]|uniref:Uncharacterized protein n=1 Tax=Phycomyces blakesleeanus TaxID=4837 RepID=A0ABR3BD46_PHYBL